MGRRDQLREIPSIIQLFDEGSPAADDLIKVEAVGRHNPIMESVGRASSEVPSYFEVALHLPPIAQVADRISQAFFQYAKHLDVEYYKDEMFFAGNLSFVPIFGTRSAVEQLAMFSFVRVVRVMPKLRGIPTSVTRTGVSMLKASLPSAPPIAEDISVAIIDGGLPEENPIHPWVARYFIPDEDAQDVVAYNDHGLGVSSAFLFGSITPGEAAKRPYAPITHIRVLDERTLGENPLELYRTLGMIEEVLLSQQYEFINLSLGPDLPIDDQEVHAWTSVIDENLADGSTFMTIAVGNNGEADIASGNARVQVPSDCVNAVAVGAVNSTTATWSRASYSAIGPGRHPGRIKPDMVAFGGSPDCYFHVLVRGAQANLAPQLGTSFAAPLVLRAAVGVRACLGDALSLLAIKALLVHSAEQNGNNIIEVGWGKIPDDPLSLTTCPEGVSRIVYQGELRSGKYLRATIPLPREVIQGRTTIRATICYSSEIDPEDSDAYTRAGLEITFRPNSSNKAAPNKHAKTKSFFTKTEFATEDELRDDAGKWETVMNAEHSFLSGTLHEPCFDIHYNARENGRSTSRRTSIHYALIVSVITPKMLDVDEKIIKAYPQLVPIRPRVTVPSIQV